MPRKFPNLNRSQGPPLHWPHPPGEPVGGWPLLCLLRGLHSRKVSRVQSGHGLGLATSLFMAVFPQTSPPSSPLSPLFTRLWGELHLFPGCPQLWQERKEQGEVGGDGGREDQIPRGGGGRGGLCPIPGTMAPWHRSPLRAGLQPVHLPPGRVEDPIFQISTLFLPPENPLHNRDHP